MNGVQTRLKCKPNVKRCKRFVFAAHSPLLHPNTLKTKAIIHFQTDHILTRFVFPPLNGEASCLINRVLIEHHSRLIELHNPFLQKEIRQWEAGVFTNSQGKLPSEANHLLLSTHILKHLINEGIGLRQLCDIAMAFNALHSVTNKNELECICRKWHIHRWNRLLYALLIKYLGVPADLLPFSTSLCPDKLMQEIWESGNFGHRDERYGERPTGKWANKRYTLKRIFHKMHLSLGYAFDETFWWLAGLALLRFKEMIKKK